MAILFDNLEEYNDPGNGDKYIKEDINLEINGRAISIKHQGIKSFANQSENSRMDLEKVIRGFMNKGDSQGFIPYNNFECSIKWRVSNG